MLEPPDPLARVQHNALKLPAPNVLQRLVEVLLALLHRHRVALAARNVGVDQLDEPVYILDCNLKEKQIVSRPGKEWEGFWDIYRLCFTDSFPWSK